MFDLTSSVAGRVQSGHQTGTEAGLLHNAICRVIVEGGNGRVVKELGDGVLCAFEDPVSGCQAALGIQRVMSDAGLVSKGSLSLGMVETFSMEVAWMSSERRLTAVPAF